jgi:glycerol-3-phosphate dehydrogenase
MLAKREDRYLNLTEGGVLDVLVIGGGITGAPIYCKLADQGHRAALIDMGDFASGTSQASGMLVWGGLLYLKNLDFSTVLKLCKARGELLRNFPEDLSVLDLHYLFRPSARRSPAMVSALLHLYWLMGGCSLKRPSRMRNPDAICYQEAMLRESDSRFVLDRIRGADSDHAIPINHCKLIAADHDFQRRQWHLQVKDQLSGKEYAIQAKAVINAAGVWTDEVNAILGIHSPCKHVFSKGVYLTFPNTRHQTTAEVFPMHGEDDVLTHVPWGPVMMWGPTETHLHRIEDGLAPTREDIMFLMDQAERSLPQPPGFEDVVSIRCGIRPLVVPASYHKNVYPLDLSRRHQSVIHHDKRSISLYGGKLTSSLHVADQVAAMIRDWLPASHIPPIRMEPSST